MEKKGMIRDLLQRRMINNIGHGARGCREDVEVMSLLYKLTLEWD